MGLKELYNEHKEAVLYVFFGALTTVVSLATYSLFVWIGIELFFSNILSWMCGVLFAFVVNKWFVFSSKSIETTTVVKELGSFFSARIITGVLAWILFPILCAVGLGGTFLNTEGMPAKIVTSILEIVMNWLFSKYWVFRKKEKIEPVEE